jgi:hypothetical protein
MYPIMLRGVVALSIATALSGDQSITPLAPSDCRAIAKTISQAVGIPLTTKEGKPDFPNGLRGTACLMSGRATGLKVEFDDVRKKLNAALAGWTHVSDYDADRLRKGFAAHRLCARDRAPARNVPERAAGRLQGAASAVELDAEGDWVQSVRATARAIRPARSEAGGKGS